MERDVLLRQLVERRRPVDEVVRDLAQFSWDAPVALVSVEPQHVVAVLDQYAKGRMTAAEVEEWADALEVRDDVDAPPQVREALFRLANPALGYELSASTIEEIRQLFDTAEESELRKRAPKGEAAGGKAADA